MSRKAVGRLSMRRFLLGGLLAASLGAAGCGGSAADDGKRHVVVTTTMIADLARNVGGDHVHVDTLMGPGIDPHQFKAGAGDVGRMRRAELILYNGLHLEGKMSDPFQEMAGLAPTVPRPKGFR